MAIKKNLMKTPIKKLDPMGLEEFRFNLGLSDLIGDWTNQRRKSSIYGCEQQLEVTNKG